jgi:uncharacterized protein YkwD
MTNKVIFGTLLLVAGLGSCNGSSSTSQPPTPANRTASPSPSAVANSNELSAIEQSVFKEINEYRQSQNLSPLTWNDEISQQARKHSEAMASGQVPLSHEGFEERVEAIAKTVSYRGAAENVAANQGHANPGQQAVQGWLSSSGHLRNIEGNYDLTGVGVAKNAQGEYYFTQIFIQPR